MDRSFVEAIAEFAQRAMQGPRARVAPGVLGVVRGEDVIELKRGATVLMPTFSTLGDLVSWADSECGGTGTYWHDPAGVTVFVDDMLEPNVVAKTVPQFTGFGALLWRWTPGDLAGGGWTSYALDEFQRLLRDEFIAENGLDEEVARVVPVALLDALRRATIKTEEGATHHVGPQSDTLGASKHVEIHAAALPTLLHLERCRLFALELECVDVTLQLRWDARTKAVAIRNVERMLPWSEAADERLLRAHAMTQQEQARHGEKTAAEGIEVEPARHMIGRPHWWGRLGHDLGCAPPGLDATEGEED